MDATELQKRIDGKIYVDSGRNVEGFYCGDFLSRVMGKAAKNCGWLTIMNNINVAGVAVLADISAVILCEGVVPADALVERCKLENVSLISTELPVFECCTKLV